MKRIKLILRIILALLLIVPTTPIFWMSCSLFGLGFMMAFIHMLYYPIAWLGDDEEGMGNCKDSFEMLLFLIASPFLFWYTFIKDGKSDLSL